MLDAAASAAGRNNALLAGPARGIAIGMAFNPIGAQGVEILGVTRSSIRMAKSTIAVDCCRPVSAGMIEQQIFGGMVHGMNAALWGRQTFTNGAANTKNFNCGRMMRIRETPQVKVMIVPAPAVANRTVPIGGIALSRYQRHRHRHLQVGHADLRAGTDQCQINGWTPAQPAVFLERHAVRLISRAHTA